MAEADDFIKNLFGSSDPGEGKEEKDSEETLEKVQEKGPEVHDEEKEDQEGEKEEEAEQEKIDEGKREMDMDAIRFQAAVFEENMKKREVESAKRARENEIREARAAVDQDEDDSEAEIKAREEARKTLAKFDGDVFDAVQSDNVELVRAFFLVKGSKKLLEKRDQTPHGGNTTLLHTASFCGKKT